MGRGISMIKNQWYGIMPSKEVPKGKLVAVKRMGLELCLFRSKKGDIGCVVDKCAHRGAALSKGKQKGECVACPFHGLEFDKEGKCTLIPANGRTANIEKRFKVTSYIVREAHGMIYFWYGENEKVTDVLPFFEDSIDGSYVYSEMRDTWNAHYSRCIENQLDVIHLPFVHHNTIGRGHKTVVNGPRVEFINGSIMLTANNSVDKGQAPKPASECSINPKTNLRFKFPNVWQNHIADDIKIVIFFAPVDDENTVFYIRFYTNKFKLKVANSLMAKVGKVMNGIIERQDKRCVITQQPKASSLSCGENLLKGDSPVIMYRKMRNALQNQENATSEQGKVTNEQEKAL